MNYNRINNITGWIVCIISCAVFLLTMEATGSLWDCGEFASSAYKLQIPHPPGAPMFTLIGRLFMAPFDPQHAATGINTMSALASGFTSLFLFWTITHFGRKITEKSGKELNSTNTFIIMAAGLVGSLANTFSDSFWYSAVEGEVYALSSFFTAIVFWAMCKWDQAVDDERKAGNTANFTRADRWIILIFYLMGLSIGVHLLNLLTIPAIVMIYYFKKYKTSLWGALIAFGMGVAITGIVQKAVIQWSIQLAGKTDVMFKNDFGLPFFTGFGFFFLLVAGLIYLGLRVARKQNWHFLQLGLWSFAFMLMGYSTYLTPLIRSNADVALDMFNVDNPVTLVGYLGREQYGDWPILYGQDFTASPSSTLSEVIDTYVKGDKEYELKGKKQILGYDPEDKSFFPRMWDSDNQQGHVDYYMSMTDNVSPNPAYDKDPQNEPRYLGKPSFGDKLNFFFSYQLNTMYLRYFMWNFAGKQNDIQGITAANVRDGNWKTGIGFYDNLRLGDQEKMPDSLKNNKANNKLFFLPFILGVIGWIFHYKRDWRNALVATLLFFFTGIAIVIYLNMAGPQPRERDYAFVGSFYAFCIFIGLGVIQVKDWLQAVIKNASVAGYASAAICTLAVPVLMAGQEWDDHNRSNKTIARDLAKDYLNSCAPNAIVFSFGDNDTYPLWYAQEVEGVRPDIRVINYSLLGTDWYIKQLRYKVNQSDAMDPIWSQEQVLGANRDFIFYSPMPGVDPNQYMDLYTMMKDWAGSDDPKKTRMSQSSNEPLNIFPSRKVSIPVDAALVRSNGTVNATDTIVPAVQFEIRKNTLQKNESAVLNIIASNKWQRPIYFTSPRACNLGFEGYVRQDGLTYRLVPAILKSPPRVDPANLDWVKEKMTKEFAFGNADKKGVYFDEENRRHLIGIRNAYASAAMNFAENNRKEDGRKLLAKCDAGIPGTPESNVPYGLVSRDQQHNYVSFTMMRAAYMCDDSVLAQNIGKYVKKDLAQQKKYYASLNNKMSESELDKLMMTYMAKQNAIKTQADQEALNSYVTDNFNSRCRSLINEIANTYILQSNIEMVEQQFSKTAPPVPAPLEPAVAPPAKAADTQKPKTP